MWKHLKLLKLASEASKAQSSWWCTMWIKVSIHPYSVIKHFKELQLFIVIIESIIIYVKMTLPEHVFFREVKNVITCNIVFNWRWWFGLENSRQKHELHPRVCLLTPLSKFCLSSTAGIRRNEPRWCNYEKYVCERINLVSLCTCC